MKTLQIALACLLACSVLTSPVNAEEDLLDQYKPGLSSYGSTLFEMLYVGKMHYRLQTMTKERAKLVDQVCVDVREAREKAVEETVASVIGRKPAQEEALDALNIMNRFTIPFVARLEEIMTPEEMKQLKQMYANFLYWAILTNDLNFRKVVGLTEKDMFEIERIYFGIRNSEDKRPFQARSLDAQRELYSLLTVDKLIRMEAIFGQANNTLLAKAIAQNRSTASKDQ